MYQHLGMIENTAYHRTMAKHSAEEQRILRRIQWQGHWTDVLQVSFYEVEKDEN